MRLVPAGTIVGGPWAYVELRVATGTLLEHTLLLGRRSGRICIGAAEAGAGERSGAQTGGEGSATHEGRHDGRDGPQVPVDNGRDSRVGVTVE